MNKLPYRDVENGGIIIGGDTYNDKSEYLEKKANEEIANMVHLTELGCDEIVKRLAKKIKHEKISNT